jgi:YD repeat-containing protein
MGSIASAVGGVVGSIGGMISGNKAADAANQQAEYLRNLSNEQRQAILDATKSAQERGQFKPVTVTSSFGTPQYTYDDKGRLTGVAAQPAPWLAELQARQQALAPQYMGLTEGALSAAPQFQRGAELAVGGAERLYGLAGQAAPTSYDTAAKTQEYFNRMQQLVAPQREQQLAQTRQSLFNTGRQGLATGATQAGGMLATNPEMAAYYNAIAQQDLELANRAETQARAQLQEDINTAGRLFQGGAGMFTQAGDAQNQLYRNVAASQSPFAAGMQAVTGLEQTAFAPVTRGFEYGGTVGGAEQWAGEMGLRGAQGAANIATSMAPSIANAQYRSDAYSPWGTLMGSLGSTIGQSDLGSWSSLFSGGGGGASAPTGYGQAANVQMGNTAPMFSNVPASGWSWR